MTPAAAPAAHAALRDAARWRLLGLLFERPRAGWREEVVTLGSAVDDERLHAAVEAASDTGEGAYQAVFGPGAPVSPREVWYRRREDPGAVLAELKAFHSAFAFAPHAEDPIDHVAVEVGFAGYLRLKAAYALAQGNEAAAATCQEAFDRFCERHLRFIAEPLAAVLDGSPLPHAAIAAHWLCDAVGPAPADATGFTGDDAGEDRSEFGCAGDCPARDANGSHGR